ncbi:MAG: translation initiation factor [Candidatus Kapabacteria bacterium]|jgi:translation initiation factor 1 (eIF-1/SUI1)|nr:translation initiation factor [Candidatus Kapabacteria bacterium]
MPGLDELAKLLPTTPSEGGPGSKQEARRGYNGEVLRLKVFSQKRKGKMFTIAQGFQSHPMELNRLLDLGRKKLGAGGQLVDQTLEFQGDHTARLKEILKAEGYRFA